MTESAQIRYSLKDVLAKYLVRDVKCRLLNGKDIVKVRRKTSSGNIVLKILPVKPLTCLATVWHCSKT